MQKSTANATKWWQPQVESNRVKTQRERASAENNKILNARNGTVHPESWAHETGNVQYKY